MAEQNVKNNNIVKIYCDKYCEIKTLSEKVTSNDSYIENDFRINSVLNIYIEPTNACNLNCDFCARENMDRDIKFLKFDAFKNTVDYLEKGTYITITGNGEPLLNKDIYRMIEYANNKGMIVSIITNGTPLTEDNAIKLIKSGVSRVQISFSSIDKKTYESEMRGSKYEDTLYKVLRFIKLSRALKSNIFITVSTVMVEAVKAFAKESKEFWTNMPIDNYYEGKLLSLQTESNAYSQITSDEESWKPCIIPWVSLRIDAGGDVTSCPQDFSSKYVIGNINESSILEIMNSQYAIKLKKAIAEGNIEFLKDINYNCHECNTWTKEVGYNCCDFLESIFPTRLALVIKETDVDRRYSEDTIRYLDENIKKLQMK